MSGINTSLNILVVEDNPGDIFLLKEFLRATDLLIEEILASAPGSTRNTRHTATNGIGSLFRPRLPVHANACYAAASAGPSLTPPPPTGGR